MKNCVYKFMNRDGEVIYIGKAKDLKSRLSNHNHLSDNCYNEVVYTMYTTFDTEHEMDFAERYYIQKLAPKYNTILSDRPISFDCDDLDNKIFKIYKVNEYLVEHTLEQIQQLKNENLYVEVNLSILEVAGMLTITKCKSYLDNVKENIKYVDEIKKIKKYFTDDVLNIFLKNLKQKYNLLDLKVAYWDVINIGKYINLEKNEYTMRLRYKEFYKDEWNSLDLIIKCK